MSLSESVQLQAIAEAKSLGSEVVNLSFVYLGVVNVLISLEAVREDDDLVIAASQIRIAEKLKQHNGFKTPVLDEEALKVIPDYLDKRTLKELGEQILRTNAQKLDVQSSQQHQRLERKSSRSVGSFHNIDGPSLGRLPKFMPQKNDAMLLITPYLMEGERYVWDGVYNTKDPQLSTRYGNAQSMGRVFVTNFRLMFWSDDEDKPHIGVFYLDITSWKTNWMPMKSRGVIMHVSGRKVIFAANSTAMEHASSQISNS